MSECVECGRYTGLGAFYPDDEGPFCRGCYRSRRRSPRASTYVSPDEAERNAEALDHDEAESRAAVLRGAP